jgi:hypothetical protein
MLTSKFLAAGVVTLTLAVCNVAATAQQVAATQVVNLPPNDTLDTWEHIMWDPTKGRNADPAECKAIGGRMGAFGPVQRCLISIKAWLARAPGNVVGEYCNPGWGRAFPALMTAEDVQQCRAKNMLVWTSADGAPFGYEQASKCIGK